MIEGVIYQYRSPSGKYYIGQTTKETARRKAFLNTKKPYAGQAIENARKKYGPSAFEYRVLVRMYGDRETVRTALDALEKEFIKTYDSQHNGYNVTPGGKKTPLTKNK